MRIMVPGTTDNDRRQGCADGLTRRASRPQPRLPVAPHPWPRVPQAAGANGRDASGLGRPPDRYAGVPVSRDVTGRPVTRLQLSSRIPFARTMAGLLAGMLVLGV